MAQILDPPKEHEADTTSPFVSLDSSFLSSNLISSIFYPTPF